MYVCVSERESAPAISANHRTLGTVTGHSQSSMSLLMGFSVRILASDHLSWGVGPCCQEHKLFKTGAGPYMAPICVAEAALNTATLLILVLTVTPSQMQGQS